jgi:D-ala D-ala ligase N-terminus.
MKNNARIEGGYSREKEIPIKRAQKINENIDKTKLNPTKVGREENEGTANESEGRNPIDKNSFSYRKENSRYNLDNALIRIQGSPGEDGKLQRHSERRGTPYNTSSSYRRAPTTHK